MLNFLEDIALPIDDTKKNASFLTSIMEKMKIGSSEERLDIRQEDDMDLLIETHPYIRPASAWFQMARLCAPMLYLEIQSERGKAMQLFVWCKAALTAVAQRLEKVTKNGENPLFPNEFGPVLKKIAEQLIGNFDCEEKLNLAVLYLFLMIPSPVRETIDHIIQWLQLTLRTDSVEDLRSPFYLGRKEPRHKENYHVIVEEIRHFMFPKGCLTNIQQDILIETMVDLRNANRLGKMPKQLEESLKSKKCKNDEEPTTPVRYAVAPKQSLREREQKNDGRSDLNPTEDALVSMIETMLNDTKMSLSEKTKQLQNFSKSYPSLYNRFFKGML
ncbi:unnamed protein product [Caenorhabditis angaria]|uniref:Uncharacterized protein n=1 Tax=Caenorhabditis angaria TaxID=860376 RepID=A0A9P1IB54_9PELO|nr:unnamed protein product [Caenorhabditis angaria]